jgi:hypothetical protein
MEARHAISSPERADDYPGRGADCMAALRPSVAELAVTSGDALSTVIKGEMPDSYADLVRRAGEAGWNEDEARDAVRALARELEGVKGAVFD